MCNLEFLLSLEALMIPRNPQPSQSPLRGGVVLSLPLMTPPTRSPYLATRVVPLLKHPGKERDQQRQAAAPPALGRAADPQGAPAGELVRGGWPRGAEETDSAEAGSSHTSPN